MTKRGSLATRMTALALSVGLLTMGSAGPALAQPRVPAGDEVPPAGGSATALTPGAALPSPIPGETLQYFVPADSDATATVVNLTNTDSVAHTVAVRGNTVTITWAPAASGGLASSYVLEVGSAPGLANLATMPVTATAFTTSGVPRGTFYVRVRAVNAVGTGPASAEATLVVP